MRAFAINIEELEEYTLNPSREVQREEIKATDVLMDWFATTQDERFRVAILLARAAIKDNY